MNIHYICISGTKHQGKDTLARYLQEALMNDQSPSLEGVWCSTVSLADAMKRAMAEALGVGLDVFYDQDLKEKPLLGGSSPRVLLQQFGTEFMKHHYGNDVWCERLVRTAKMIEEELSEHQYTDLFILIPDVRFPEELAFFNKLNSKLIFIYRDFDVNAKKDSHSSERGLYEYYSENDHWWVDNTKGLDDLKKNAYYIAEQLTKRIV